MILDTHTLLWMDRDDISLGSTARSAIELAWRTASVGVSAVTFWEVAMLSERGRISLPVPVEKWRTDWLQAGLLEFPLNGHVALLASALRGLHHDPTDRYILATAIDQNSPLITADPRILGWAGKLERIDAGH